jgi:hypothetical protein
MGIIYKIDGPSGSYIGQTMYTLESRWKVHLKSALSDDKKRQCTYLGAAIRKYGEQAFTREVIITCNDDELDKNEIEMIAKYNTLRPNGYNLKEGGANGKHSAETCQKISETQLGKSRPESYVKWFINNNVLKKTDQTLPMFVIEYKRKAVLIGYQVCNHPSGKYKAFLSMKLSLEEKKQKALEYLEILNNTINE